MLASSGDPFTASHKRKWAAACLALLLGSLALAAIADTDAPVDASVLEQAPPAETGASTEELAGQLRQELAGVFNNRVTKAVAAEPGLGTSVRAGMQTVGGLSRSTDDLNVQGSMIGSPGFKRKWKNMVRAVNGLGHNSGHLARELAVLVANEDSVKDVQANSAGSNVLNLSPLLRAVDAKIIGGNVRNEALRVKVARQITEDAAFRAAVAREIVQLRRLAAKDGKQVPGAGGAPGRVGAPGPRGPLGPQGPVGTHGGKGPRGPQGRTVKGPRGRTGRVGPKGPDGRRGAAGASGATGFNGKKGAAGRRGGLGMRGKRGLHGMRGNVGAHGRRGPKGAAGAIGPVGPIGPQGRTGPQGSPGAAGALGPPGINGKAGGQGPLGPPGKDGLAGTPGSPGANGRPGLPGTPGSVGPRGARGVVGRGGRTGAAGHAGRRGGRGRQGSRGPPGPTGPNGHRGRGGPKGYAGARGSRGAQGTPGSAGPTGHRGATGPRGGRGSSGRTGKTGAVGAPGGRGGRGASGARGSSGRNGVNGPRGRPGTPGHAGQRGAAGSPGPLGPSGPRGSAGAPGAKGSTGAVGPVGPRGHPGPRGYSAAHIHGTAIDITTGRPIKQVLLRVQNSAGRTVEQRSVDGDYKVNLVPGQYKLTFSRSGYITSSVNVIATAGDDVRQNLLCNPSMGDKKLRVVLTWATEPRDLDAYMHTAKDGGNCIVSWRNMGCHDNSISMDVDAMDSHGPETMTIKKWEAGSYVYKVKQFSSDGSLLTSGATVDIYGPRSSDRRTFKIGTNGAVEGKIWTVFSIGGSGHVISEYKKCAPGYNKVAEAAGSVKLNEAYWRGKCPAFGTVGPSSRIKMEIGGRTWLFKPKREMKFCDFILSKNRASTRAYTMKSEDSQLPYANGNFLNVGAAANQIVSSSDRHGGGHFTDYPTTSFGGAMLAATQIPRTRGFFRLTLVAPSWGSEQQTGAFSWSGQKVWDPARNPTRRSISLYYVHDNQGNDWGKPIKVWVKGSSRC